MAKPNTSHQRENEDNAELDKYNEAMEALREAYRSGKAGPGGLVALANELGLTVQDTVIIRRQVEKDRS